ncbi:PspA-associated protein PspAB [Aeromicrobium alkaliterrae]|uniref:Uncharacterized protein n=1 Tax=Aeromicrobium alkaliterrae TaxID=302168 RepID=A0ABN2JNP5_9ACTN
MGLFDAILGRSKPPEADLDILFQVPQAVLSLEAQGFTFTGTGGVCFRDVEGNADNLSVDEAEQLVRLDGTATVERSDDSFGFHWLTVTRPGDAPGLCTDLHAVNSGLAQAGFSSSLLCSTVVFTAPDGGPLGLVYLFKRGTFYPFAPRGEQRRDNALELQVRGAVANDVPVESDLSRWLALWGAPHLA